LGDDVGRLAGLGSLLGGDGTLGFDVGRVHAGCVQGLGTAGGDVHGQVLAHFLGAGEVDQNADLAAVDVAGQLAGGFIALEAAHGDVLADLADQGGAHAFNGAVGQR